LGKKGSGQSREKGNKRGKYGQRMKAKKLSDRQGGKKKKVRYPAELGVLEN